MNYLMPLLSILFFASTALASDLSEADVKAILSDWVAAQNNGSYASYADMYAEKFLGIKRSGNRTYRYNHDAWLKDRKYMFKNAMKVEINNVIIQKHETGAVVGFNQTWENKNYKDKGQKRMHLVVEDNKTKISREEMLTSKVLPGKGIVIDSNNFPFAFAINEGIVIQNVTIKSEYVQSEPFLTSKEPFHVATASVNTQLLPQGIKSLVGMQVRTYSAKGSCESRINGFKLVSKEVPHFGEIERWKENKTPDKKIADTVFSEGKLHLVATTEKCSGDFAKDARLPQSPIALPKKVDKAMKNKIWDAFKALPLYKKEIKPYVKEITGESYRKFVLSRNGNISNWVSIFITGDQSCASEGGTLGSLWRVVEEAKGLSLKWVKYLDEDIEYATDIENDGIPEFYYENSFPGVYTNFGFVSGTSGNDDKRFEESAYYDCPC